MKLIDPPFAIIPWTVASSGPVGPLLAEMWILLQKENLGQIVFHENNMEFGQYMSFFAQPTVMPQILAEVDEQMTIKALVGMTWLSDVSQLPSHVRATGSFAYLRAYQSRKWTVPFGERVLRYWLTPPPAGLGIDLLVGLTPRPNRAAQKYSRFMGLEYIACLEGYSSYGGAACDAMIAKMTRSDFERRFGPLFEVTASNSLQEV